MLAISILIAFQNNSFIKFVGGNDSYFTKMSYIFCHEGLWEKRLGRSGDGQPKQIARYRQSTLLWKRLALGCPDRSPGWGELDCLAKIEHAKLLPGATGLPDQGCFCVNKRRLEYANGYRNHVQTEIDHCFYLERTRLVSVKAADKQRDWRIENCWWGFRDWRSFLTGLHVAVRPELTRWITHADIVRL